MSPRTRLARRLAVIATAGLGLTLAAADSAPVGAAASHTVQARNDSYQTDPGHPLSVDPFHGILGNDTGNPTSLIVHSDPSHGALELQPDGSFTYVPNNGFAGTDSFTYTISDAVRLFSTHLPPLATIGGVNITAGGFGSSLYPAPFSIDEFYGVTDRGPNVAAPTGTNVDVEPLPNFDPSIGKFRMGPDGRADLERIIPLKDAQGHPYSGRVNSQNPTGETILDLNGNVLPTDPNGYDAEGLVAMLDGTFWVSDEYGPFVTHFDNNGRQIGRLSPFDGTLPSELANRVPNRGMEGLTITPDHSMLVGMMQSALQQPDIGSLNAKKIAVLRIVTYKLRTGEEHEYLYLLDNPGTNGTAVSEITALSNTTFLVDERDGNFPPNTYKKLWRIDLTGATDIGPSSKVAGAVYDASKGGLLIGGKTLEALVGTTATATAQATLADNGIATTSKDLSLDLGGLLVALDPEGRFFSHDKVEGVAALLGGQSLVISNDSDFGIDGVANSMPPYQLHAKVSPVTGKQDDGEFLQVDMNHLPAVVSSATVTIQVRNSNHFGFPF